MTDFETMYGDLEGTHTIEVLKPQEIAKALKVSESLVYRWISNGSLPCLTLPGQVKRILKEDFVRFVMDSQGIKGKLTG